MKKVGVITFHNSHNCGSILQTYALQHTLIDKYNLDAEIIDFVNDGSREKYSFYIKNSSIKNIIKNILYFYNFKIKKSKYFSYDEYIQKHLKLSSIQYSSINEMTNIEDNYDLFISGSDQIWNITCQDADDAYFLPFVKTKKKIAYSPSLGAKSIVRFADDVKKYEQYLNDYDFLSVREKNGKKWLSELTSKHIEVLPDPTLLLSRDDYKKISIDSKIKGDYIFYYSYGYDDKENEIVDGIAKKLGIPVYIFNGKRYCTLKYRFKSFRIARTENPGVFIDLMENAKYVFTSSFHGTVFSTIFHKKFFVFKNNGMLNGDDRVSCLLEDLDLTQRFINVTDNFDFSLLDSEIDFALIDKNVAKLQKKAFDFLEKSIWSDDNE